MLRILLGLSIGSVIWAQSSTALKVTPAALTFSFTLGDAKLPAAQTLAISGPAGANATITPAGGLWLTVTPLSGAMPVSAKVSVNPTTLAVGTYTGTVTVAAPSATPDPVVVAVQLVVKAPPSSFAVSPNPVAVTYVRGNANPAPVTLALTTSEGLLAYSVAVAGAPWLTASPRSGAIFPAFPANVTLTVNPAGLAPGTYRGTVTVTVPQASNKSASVTVNLTVNPGTPSFTSVWPARITQGAGATTISLNGSNFFTGTVIKAASTTLTSTFLGSNAITAVLPPDLLASPGTISITAQNPGSGGGTSTAQTFTVLSSTPSIGAVANAASFLTGPVAPGTMVTLFGTALGPDTLATFAPPTGGGTIATTLAGTRVLFGSTAAPVIYASADQTAAMVPYNVSGQGSVGVKVEYNGVQSSAVTVSVTSSTPAIFTASGTGTGQAVAFNYDEATGGYSLNSESNAAAKGGVVILYATGEGVTSPASADGQIATQASSTPIATAVVHIGGSDSQVLYAGAVPGLVTGIIQVNVRIPQTPPANKAIPVLLFVNGVQSQAGVTIAIK